MQMRDPSAVFVWRAEARKLLTGFDEPAFPEILDGLDAEMTVQCIEYRASFRSVLQNNNRAVVEKNDIALNGEHFAWQGRENRTTRLLKKIQPDVHRPIFRTKLLKLFSPINEPSLVIPTHADFCSFIAQVSKHLLACDLRLHHIRRFPVERADTEVKYVNRAGSRIRTNDRVKRFTMFFQPGNKRPVTGKGFHAAGCANTIRGQLGRIWSNELE